MRPIVVLRLGHRPQRDVRVTTHVCLVARALGAEKVMMSPGDERIEKTLASLTKRFGGDFKVEGLVRWKDAAKKWKEAGGQVVHLTMYGMPLEEGIAKLDGEKPLLVAVGAEKVPPDMYALADLNVAVGNQPHSEVAALAVFLDRVSKGAWARKSFGGSLEVVPRARGKEMRVRT